MASIAADADLRRDHARQTIEHLHPHRDGPEMCFAGLSARFRPASSAPRRALVSSDASQMPIYCTVKNRRTANRVAFYAAIKKKHSRKFAGSETASLRMRNGATTKHKGMSEPRRSKPARPGAEERKGQRSMSAVEHAGNPGGDAFVRLARKIQFDRAPRTKDAIRSGASRRRISSFARDANEIIRMAPGTDFRKCASPAGTRRRTAIPSRAVGSRSGSSSPRHALRRYPLRHPCLRSPPSA